MKQINLDQDLVDFLTSRSTSTGEPLGSVLRRELRVPPPQTVVTIDDETYAAIVAKARALGETASEILRRELLTTVTPPAGSGTPPPTPTPVTPDSPPPPTAAAPAIVTFRIRTAIGSTSWNDRATMVEARVGDTLRLVNDDPTPHRLHTPGRPFPHPVADIMPGDSADFLLQTTYNPDAEGPLSDHDFGPDAQFWLRVVERA